MTIKALPIRFGYCLRLVFAALALWALWVVWKPVYFSLPDTLLQPQSATELSALAAGSDFLLAGRVEPLAEPGPVWQGCFAYLHRQRQDVGSRSKTVRIVTVDEQRPAVRFIWSGGELLLPADSYDLRYAPRLKPRLWPRKWLWTTRVDDWDGSSTGFRAGQEAFAFGTASAGNEPVIAMLVSAPLEEAQRVIGSANTGRRWLILATKAGLSLFVISFCMPRRTPEA